MTLAIAIHGGAGTLTRSDMTPEKEAAYRAALGAALDAGHGVLLRGGSALDAVTAAVTSMEDDILFNAGRGSAFALDGTITMDASVMEGHTREAGSVTGVTAARNPVLLARCVMEKTPLVMLGFKGADQLALDRGLECRPPEYFFTQRRWDAMQEEKARVEAGIPDAGVGEDRKHGTVGAVALDARGHLAAATSTGGRTAKWAGRIGDSPVIGAGTWADGTCAVSCTGDGECFIRIAAAHDVAARMAYLGETAEQASGQVIHGALAGLGSTGGMIVVDGAGNVAMPFHCEGMYRGMVDGRGRRQIAIYEQD
jgi:beta-aspartyl-peptidase (threonine type)